MSTVTAPNSTRHDEPAAGRSGAPAAAHDDAVLLAAVREGATRGAIAAGLGGLVVIHAIDAVGKWTETRYVFWLYVLAMLGAIAVAGWTLFTRSRSSLLAAAALSGGVLLGFIVNRTVGLPNAMDDIGNWNEPIGLASMVVESATVAVALVAFALSGRDARVR